jgi:hypothetical protein
VFAASLDGTVVATLVGSIASDFEASEQAAWLGSSYLLSVCCFTPIYGVSVRRRSGRGEEGQVRQRR